jgi:hypothetical protein
MVKNTYRARRAKTPWQVERSGEEQECKVQGYISFELRWADCGRISIACKLKL